MRYGLYHPVLGYWEAIGDKPLIEDCSAGTQFVPLRPDNEHQYDGNEWKHIPPIAPTVDELRAQMPDKTPREFRDILTDMGVFPHMVATKINEIPFDIERQKALNAWEVSTYISRIDPYVDMIGAMFDKSPAEIDTAWLA